MARKYTAAQQVNTGKSTVYTRETSIETVSGTRKRYTPFLKLSKKLKIKSSKKKGAGGKGG